MTTVANRATPSWFDKLTTRAIGRSEDPMVRDDLTGSEDLMVREDLMVSLSNHEVRASSEAPCP